MRLKRRPRGAASSKARPVAVPTQSAYTPAAPRPLRRSRWALGGDHAHAAGGLGATSLADALALAPGPVSPAAAQSAGLATGGHHADANNTLERLFDGDCAPCKRRTISGLRVGPGQNRPLRLARQQLRERHARRLDCNQRANTELSSQYFQRR